MQLLGVVAASTGPVNATLLEQRRRRLRSPTAVDARSLSGISSPIANRDFTSCRNRGIGMSQITLGEVPQELDHRLRELARAQNRSFF